MNAPTRDCRTALAFAALALSILGTIFFLMPALDWWTHVLKGEHQHGGSP